MVVGKGKERMMGDCCSPWWRIIDQYLNGVASHDSIVIFRQACSLQPLAHLIARRSYLCDWSSPTLFEWQEVALDSKSDRGEVLGRGRLVRKA